MRAVLRQVQGGGWRERPARADNAGVGAVERFDAGDVVRLRSGGPPMVVRAASGDTAYCQWFAGLELRQGTFLFSSLRNVSSERRNGEAAPADFFTRALR